MDPELLDLSMEELELLYRHNNKTVARLQEEITLCQKHFKLYGPGAELPHQVNIHQRSDGSTNLSEINHALEHTLLTLERRLSETEKLTGIRIVNVKESTEETDEDLSSRSLELELDVLGSTMHLSCDIETDLTEGGDSGSVSWFSLQIAESINKVIGQVLSQFSEKLELHPILSVVKSYLRCIKERDRLIQHFVNSDPEHVTPWDQSQNKQGFKITSPDNRLTFIFEWGLVLDDGFQYAPHVTLTVQTSREIKRLDTKGLLDSASNVFTNMVSLVGVEKAVTNFIPMVLSDGIDILSNQRLQAIQQTDEYNIDT